MGGFGIVYRAWDPRVDREVALKVPRPELLGSAEAQARFEQEARAVAKLDHPHIVPVLEAGMAGVTPYIASAFYRGTNLAAWLGEQRQGGPVRAAARLVRDLADAVAHAHARGVLHRDIKPSNVLLVQTSGAGPADELAEMTPKLMDFGLAKLADGTRDMTQSGALLGTIRYMAPEQAAGRLGEIGAATDVYSLGAVLYELLAGVTPFGGQSDLEVLRRIADAEPSRIRLRRPETPRDLETIALKCLEREPGKRYQTARDLADDLDRFLGGLPVKARQPTVVGRLGKWSRRNPALASLFVVIAVAGMALVGGLAWSNVRISDALTTARASEQRMQQLLYASDLQLAQQASSNNETGRALEILGRYRPASDEIDRREFGWHFLWRMLNRQVAELPRHPGDVYGVACSPDGATIVTVCRDGKTRFWSYPALSLQTEVGEHSGEVGSVSFSPDGRLLATGGDDGVVVLWDVATHKPVRKLRHGTSEKTDEVGAFAFSRDGRVLYVAADKSLYRWDVQTGSQLQRVEVFERAIRSIDLASDGQRIVAAAASIKVYATDDFRLLREIPPKRNAKYPLAIFVDDDEHLAAADGTGHIDILDASSGQFLAGCKTHHSQRVCAVAWSKDRQHLISGGADRLTQVFEGSTWDCVATFQHHSARVWDVEFIPNHPVFVSASADGRVCFWNTPVDSRFESSQGIISRLLDESGLHAMSYSRDGRFLVCGGSTHALYVLDRTTDKLVRFVNVDATSAVLISHDGNRLIQGTESEILLRDAKDGKLIQQWPTQDAVCHLAWSPQEDCFSAQAGRLVLLIDFPSGEIRRTLGPFDEPVHAVRFTRDGKLLASLPGKMVVIDRASGQQTMQIGQTGETFEGFELFPDGRRMIVAEGLNGVTIREVSTGAILQRLAGHPGNAVDVAVHPDGRHVASSAIEMFCASGTWRPVRRF